MTVSEDMFMWTIYDRPRDFPTLFVARKFRISARGAFPTHEIITHLTLSDLRARMRARGLTCLERSPEDEPQIVEIWL